ncbi:MAG: hypothetical protein ACI9TY_001801 [Alphaproteobacteria bacterium]|jgi:hypothetical protein
MVAAKLFYNRWDEAKKNDDFQSVHHTENEQQDLVEIERLQKDIQELEHDAGNST